MKHKRQDRPMKKNIALPTSIVERVEDQLRDPFTGRAQFGAWAALLTGLLIKWLNGDVKVTVPLRKVMPFCHICLLDKELYHTCNNPKCPMEKPDDSNPTAEVQEGSTESVPDSEHN